jgi:hypothetical protein
LFTGCPVALVTTVQKSSAVAVWYYVRGEVRVNAASKELGANAGLDHAKHGAHLLVRDRSNSSLIFSSLPARN